MLEIDSVDWHLLENAKAHHTDRYEIVHEESTPVLRRSQPFKITITFKNRPFNEQTDNLRLLINHDKSKPTPRFQALKEDTTVTSANKINNSKTQWSIQLDSQQQNKITVLVRSPPVAAWGMWNLKIKISYKLDAKISIWNCPTQFWVLFNPWNKDDDVYMPDTKYLDEYVLCDVGKVYTRGSGKPIGMKWIYGQFASPILKVLKTIVDVKELEDNELGSPVEMAKAIRRVGSIVEGNWGGSFEGGTAPWLWTGSVPIFEEYLETGNAKFAQCYVYAAILTTAFRAAGIPSRNVTNFLSSTGGSNTMCINSIYSTSGEVIEEGPMIWNFHVWNDAWMARYDLPVGYGGWQAVDCMGAGPAPLEAVKKGEICLNHDVRHIMAECNSDRARWTKDSNGEFHLVKVDPDYTGKSMLTKQPFIYDPHGDTDFQDIASLYKEPEGSKEERMAVYNAIRLCKKINKEEHDKILAEIDPEDLEMFNEYFEKPLYHIDIPDEESKVKFELKEIETILFGQQLILALKIKNLGEKSITVEACFSSSSVYYNGAKAGLIKKHSKSASVNPQSNCTISVVINPQEYAAKIVEFTLLSISCIAKVKETNYTWANDFQLSIDMPEVVITSKGDLEEGKDGILIFQFKNLLRTKLTKCSLRYEAPGIGRNVKIPCRDIKVEEEVKIEHKVKPNKSGHIIINTIFTSKELNFLGGSSVVLVN